MPLALKLNEQIRKNKTLSPESVNSLMLNDVISIYINKKVLVYLNEILVYSELLKEITGFICSFLENHEL